MQRSDLPTALRALVFAVLVSSLLLGWPTGVLAQDDQDEPQMSEECRRLRADVMADVGEVMRAGCQPTIGQMSRLMDNPLGNVAMFINQLDYFHLTNDSTSADGEAQLNYMGIIQFPTAISEKWNVIHRIVYNVPSTPIDQDKIDDLGIRRPPSMPPGGGPSQPPTESGLLPIDIIGGRTAGWGDMAWLGLLSPKAPITHERGLPGDGGGGGSSVWGFGVAQSFPTATEDVLGSGKWSAGPSALYAYLGPRWKLGFLLQNYFSYGGSGKRDDVNLSNLQLFYYYSVTETISIGAGPNIIANWEADNGDQWTVPLGMGIGKTFSLGKLPVRVMLEYHGSMVRPDTVGSTHNLRFLVIPAVPAAMIPFLPI